MGKSTHFSGQPLYSQIINLLDKNKIIQISKQHAGERYIKSFNCWSHLVVMLYAVIMRFDSLGGDIHIYASRGSQAISLRSCYHA